MTAELLQLDPKFDATHMSPGEIMQEVRLRGWYDYRLDMKNFMASDEITVRQLPKRDSR